VSFVRSKMVNGYGPYFYEVENHRMNGSSRQKVIRYLGHNLRAHIADSNASGARSTPQDANSDSDKDEIQEKLARNEAERNIIQTSDAPESRKSEALRRRSIGMSSCHPLP
jgi:hypothetical protein